LFEKTKRNISLSFSFLRDPFLFDYCLRDPFLFDYCLKKEKERETFLAKTRALSTGRSRQILLKFYCFGPVFNQFAKKKRQKKKNMSTQKI